MSLVREVNIKITGQVPDDLGNRDYLILIAKLQIICAEYDLELEE